MIAGCDQERRRENEGIVDWRNSMAITRKLVRDGWEVFLLNRGSRSGELPEGVCTITADINDEEAAARGIGDMHFDCVGEFIGFKKEQVERDYRLFAGRCGQYLYISSASAYHKPLGSYVIDEGTSLANPYWQYSRDKIACEEFLMQKYREEGFPVTIVRPSHTYDERHVPVDDGEQACHHPGRWDEPVDIDLQHRFRSRLHRPDGGSSCHRGSVPDHIG